MLTLTRTGGPAPGLRDLSDPARVRDAVDPAAAAPRPSASRAGLIARAAAGLLGMGADPSRAPVVFFVPGRIEVLGKHTDYCGGRSLLAAVEQGMAFVAQPGDGAALEVLDAVSGERCVLEVAPGIEPRRGHWSNYPAAVARRTARNFPGARGARIAFAGDLPPAAGMSSSSALITGFFLVLARANGLEEAEGFRRPVPDLESLAAYLASVENGSGFRGLEGDLGVGTEGGSEDHTAILLSRPGRLGLFSFAPLRAEPPVPLPAGFVFAVASSGIAAEKTGAAMERYNRASRLARAAVEVWNRTSGGSAPHLAAAIAAAGGWESFRRLLQRSEPAGFAREDVLRRAEHFESESDAIIPIAAEALRKGDVRMFGYLVDRSQQKGASLLGNQIPETEFLAEAARRLGAVAASAFGAGFGGSVWALVDAARAEEFLAAWRRVYRERFPTPARSSAFLVTGAASAAFEIAREPV